jgi:D-alanyl-D-alanine carboxypeptidase
MPVKKIFLLATILLILLNLFWLPTFSHWRHYPHGQSISQDLPQLLVYKHPNIPSVKQSQLPVLNSTNYILIDSATNQILLSHNPKTKIYPASITKLATALTALNIYPLDEVITVRNEYKEGKIMELQLGEKISIRNLVTALLVYSANDSAYNLAEYHTQGTSGFINEMNLLAKKYQLNDTHFTNYDGIHNDLHYSTVYDLSQLARLALKNNTVKEIVRQKEITVTDISGSITHKLTSTNELLGVVPEIEGLKTGWTPEAKGAFVGFINLNGHYLISVVANSDDRFGDTRQLIDWSKANISWSEYSSK